MNTLEMFANRCNRILGVHILKELVYNNKVDRVYCLVRQKNNLSSEERFKKQLAFFFEADVVKKIMSKTSVVNGDITNPQLFNDEFNEKIDVIINSAARVSTMVIIINSIMLMCWALKI